eukprot:TRINITY_DN8663_c0_g1_i1.p1 TRINITY_DN8663_c0_g1~~TRINITY_DN8663_c0_g1_i1.p1  ORF type:complete len:234 (-),score=29.94 TRINITY_DN8663_c0_g1_i1:23-685(-)
MQIATREANVCEKLRRGGGHRNIAKYLGCVQRDGCVAALCFPKYYETLAERVDRGCTPANVADVVVGLWSAVHHLHRMELSHNDINPSNIMFAGPTDKTPIPIDFDSCGEVGAKMFKGSTPGWGDENRPMVACKEYDADAIGRIEAYLAKHGLTVAAQMVFRATASRRFRALPVPMRWACLDCQRARMSALYGGRRLAVLSGAASFGKHFVYWGELTKKN